MDSPHFFVDRSLGGVTVPRLLREAGWELTTLAEHYGKPADEAVDDVDWLALAGGNGWPVLMKDAEIRRRAAERAALVNAGVRAFCLASGNLKSADMAGLFIHHQATIWQRASGDGPGLWSVSRSEVRRTDV